jgi:hypothetical protein
MKFLSESNSNDKGALLELESKMTKYYNTVSDYSAFADNIVSTHKGQWDNIIKMINKIFSNENKIKILEVGAGISGFGDYVKQYNLNIFYACQDVTTKNMEYLEQNADKVYIGDISNITEKFHVVFS